MRSIVGLRFRHSICNPGFGDRLGGKLSKVTGIFIQVHKVVTVISFLYVTLLSVRSVSADVPLKM